MKTRATIRLPAEVYAELVRAGTEMASLCFDLRQEREPLGVDRLRDAQERWDAALQAARERGQGQQR